MQIILLITISAIVIAIILKYKEKHVPDKICTTCGFVGKPIRKLQGSGLVELLLWLFFLIPGLIYSAWRGSGGVNSCPSCGNRTMIPLDSPMGQKFLRSFRK